MKFWIAILAFNFCVIGDSLSQDSLYQNVGNYHLNSFHSRNVQKFILESKVIYHHAVQPYLSGAYEKDNIQYRQDSLYKTRTKWFGRKFFQEHFAVIDTNDLYMTIDPLINVQMGKDLADNSVWADTTTFYTNSRGITISAAIGNEVTFSTSFIENQSFLPSYLDSFANKYKETAFRNGQEVEYTGFGLIPGQGRAKPFKKTGYDYAYAVGYVGYNPSDRFHFQVGHGKHFIGNGYRSLLLSDNAFNYPYARVQSSWANNKIQYTNIFASLQSLSRIPYFTTLESPFERKAGSFHYLSFKPNRFLEVGFFEGMIWQQRDSLGSKKLSPRFMMPIAGLNAALEGLDGMNNAVIGVNFLFVPFKSYSLYGQLLLDGPGLDGYQLGMKGMDLAGVVNLDIQVEYNTVANYSYSHAYPLQNYAHYNQGLAHPFGAGFSELNLRLDYSYQRYLVHLDLISAQYLQDENGSNYGKNIFNSNKDRTLVSDLTYKSFLSVQNMYLAYVFNQKSNMQVILGVTNRAEAKSYGTDFTQFVYFGFKTSLSNNYYDF